MIIESVCEKGVHTALQLEDGTEIIIRPSLEIFEAHCEERGVEIVGNFLNIIDYSSMTENWADVVEIYGKIARSQVFAGFNPPKSYEEFEGRIFDVYKGVKEDSISLAKEYSINYGSTVTWLFRNNRRCFIDYAKAKIRIEKELEDIIPSA